VGFEHEQRALSRLGPLGALFGDGPCAAEFRSEHGHLLL